MDEREVLQTLTGLGFGEPDARTLADHFLDAESRSGARPFQVSGWRRVRSRLDPSAQPRRLVSEPGYERWDGNGARLPDAGCVVGRSSPIPSDHAAGRRAADVSDRDARLLGPSSRPADHRRAHAPRPPGSAIEGGPNATQPAGVAIPSGRGAARQRCLDGPRHRRRGARRSGGRGRARALRRGSRAQGLRAGGRAAAAGGLARGRARPRSGVAGGAAGGRPAAGATSPRRRFAPAR